MGILFAFIALGCWGLGDFLIEKTTRRFGDWLALFYIAAFAGIVLFPFIVPELPALLLDPAMLGILVLASVLVLTAALFNFEALKIGKISVVEPIFALELIIVVALDVFLLQEHLSFWQGLFIFLLMIGIILIATESLHHFKNIHVEKGFWYAVAGTVFMGCVNFLFGIGSREASPLMVNWFTSFFIAVVCLAYLLYHRRGKEIYHDLRTNKRLIFGVSLVDNLAWIAYSYATLTIPIAIATGISESYIALGAILGLIFNKEKLKTHQWVGLVVAILAAVILATIS